MTFRAGAGVARVALVALAVVAVVAGCRDGDQAPPDPIDLTGSWDVTLVIGAADADPDAPDGLVPGLEPGEATFVEHWRFDGCDASGCTLRRPDGGILLGDLDGLRLTLDPETDRFVGEGEAANPPPIEDATGCDSASTQRWTVTVDLGVTDDVLSGAVQRSPEALRADVEGETCFGIGLSLGLSGIPRADGDAQGQG